jgi:hypothetical protein
MQNGQLQRLQDWFDKYVQAFYGDDEFLNANIELKDNHSRRVCEEMCFLTDRLGLGESDSKLARAIALLHDTGRFRQFTEYRTYNDSRSVNHSGLGLKIIRDNDILSDLPADEKKIIETSIGLHNAKELPSGLDDKTLLMSRLIRDADKLDIYYVVISYYSKYHKDPDNFKLEIELPDSPGYTGEIVEQVAKGQRVDYRKLNNWNDMKILQLGWVYDINFTPALVRVKQKEYLQKILKFLPEDEDILRLRGIIFEYMDKRIEGSESFKKENKAS